MDSESGLRSRVVLKTISRMPGTFINQLYAVDTAVAAWVSVTSISFAAWAVFLGNDRAGGPHGLLLEEQVRDVAWTFEVQTAAFGAVLLLNVLNLGMRQHLLPFKCNLLLLFINSVAFVTDLLLWWGATTITTSATGRLFAPLRYIQWCHTTPTMIYMLALMADCGGWRLVVSLLNDVAMVLTGLAACYTVGPMKDALTVTSFVTFAVVMFYIYGMFQKTLACDASPEQRGTLRTVMVLLLALWSAFPVVWLAADWHLITPGTEAVCWGVCDYLAKVVFSSQLWQSNLTRLQLRRDRALEAWEASNRLEAVTRLTALLKQRDDLLSTLSHELRTPLAGIVALTESLCAEVSAALPAAARTVATVRATATCMLNIVTSTLDSFAPRHGASGVVCGPADHIFEPAALQHLKGPGQGNGTLDGRSVTGCGGEAASLSLVDLRPLIETVTSVLRPLANDGVAVVNDLPRVLPYVCADATRLSQVLYNLVGNAMRFTSQGEVRISARLILPEGVDPDSYSDGHTVTAGPDCAAGGAEGPPPAAVATPMAGLWRYRRRRPSTSSSVSTTSSRCSAALSPPPGSQVEISVEDTGVGIPQDLLDELFLPYRTGASVRAAAGAGGRLSDGGLQDAALAVTGATAMGGTGLGLYLVRLALRAQGSDVTAESAPGLGSVFRFRLPVALQALVHQHLQQQQQLLQQSQNRKHLMGSGGERKARHRKKKQAQVQDPEQERLLEDLAYPVTAAACTVATVSAASSDGRDVDGQQCSGGDTASTAPAQCTHNSFSAPWVASAHARLGGGGSGGGGSMAPVEPSLSPLHKGCLRLDVPSRTLSGAAPHSKQLQRLRRSLDEQRRLRQMATEEAAAAAGAAAAGVTGRGIGAVLGPGGGATSCSGATEPGHPCCSPLLAVRSGALRCDCTSDAGAEAGGCAPLGTPMAYSVTGAVHPPGGAGVCQGGAPGATACAVQSVPAAAAVALATPAASPKAPSGPQSFRHKNKGTLQVMSVDDDPINQLVAGQMLTSQTWKVVKYMNGTEALKHLRLNPRPPTAASSSADGAGAADPDASSLASSVADAARPLLQSDLVLPDCMLLDVMMPGMSGFEVCRRLREAFSPAQLPVIIVSAKGDAAAVEEAFESGADDYVTKPYKRTEMVARIKAQIRIRDSALAAAAAAAVAMPTATLTASRASGTLPTGVVVPAGEGDAQRLTSDHLGMVSSAGEVRGARAGLLGSGQPGPGAALRNSYPSNVSPRVRLSPEAAARLDRPSSVDVLSLPMASRGPDVRGAAGRAAGAADGSRLRKAVTAQYARSESLQDSTDRVGEGTARTTEHVLVPDAFLYSTLCDASTAPAAMLSASPQEGQPTVFMQPLPLSQRPPLPGQLTSPEMARDTAAGSSTPLPKLMFAHSAASAAEATCEQASAAPGVASAIGSAATPLSLLEEVLLEVRRGRATEAELARLSARLATLQAACGTLAAERDGWRRQARELRALVAAGLGGGTAAAAVASNGAGSGSVSSAFSVLASPSPLPDPLTGSARHAEIGPCPSSHLVEALVAPHASQSSGGHSGGGGPSGAPSGPGAAGGGSGGGGSSGGTVAEQLEALKQEAARLRQQLNYALASVGNGSNCSMNMTTGDTTAGPGFVMGTALLASQCGMDPQVAPEAGSVGLDMVVVGSGTTAPTTRTASAAAGCPPLTHGAGAAAGATTAAAASSAAAAGTAAASWDAIAVTHPTCSEGGASRRGMLFSTQASGLSSASGAGGCGAGGHGGLTADGDGGGDAGVTVRAAEVFASSATSRGPDGAAAGIQGSVTWPVSDAAAAPEGVGGVRDVAEGAGGPTGGVHRSAEVVDGMAVASISLPCDSVCRAATGIGVECQSVSLLEAAEELLVKGAGSSTAAVTAAVTHSNSRAISEAPSLTPARSIAQALTQAALVVNSHVMPSPPSPSPPSPLVLAPLPATSGGSTRSGQRGRGGGGGGSTSGGSGILRLLCSKGALPSASSNGGSHK